MNVTRILSLVAALGVVTLAACKKESPATADDAGADTGAAAATIDAAPEVDAAVAADTATVDATAPLATVTATAKATAKPAATPTPPPAPAGNKDVICAKARAAQKRGSPAGPALEAQCKALGGTM